MKYDIPLKRYIRAIIQLEQDYMIGMKAQGSRWTTQGLFHWKTIIKDEDEVPVDIDISLPDFHVQQLMAAWNNGQVTRINMDGRRIRNELVIKLLAYKENSRKNFFPKEV